MASWKDRLRPASFSGILFHVTDAEDSGGRRAGVHEFPLRDRPFVVELGRVARTIRVEGYLIGDNYAVLRERLRAKFDTASPGFPNRPGRTLHLPDADPVKVLCRSYTFRHSTDEGRWVRFFADFVEVGEEVSPAPAVDGAGQADAAGEAVAAAQAESFAEEVQVEGVIEQAREAISDVIVAATRTLRRLDVFSGIARHVARLEDQLTQLVTQASTLVTAPADLAARVVIALDTVLDAAATATGALEAYRALFEFPPTENLGTGLQGDIARENGRQAALLWRVGAAAGAVRAAARVDWETLEDAQETRAELGAVLDVLAGEVADDVLQTLETLRATLGRTVPPPDRDLPSLRTLTLSATMPALVVAFDLYQDEARDEEIVARNRVRDPLLVPGGVPLLVLTR